MGVLRRMNSSLSRTLSKNLDQCRTTLLSLTVQNAQWPLSVYARPVAAWSRLEASSASTWTTLESCLALLVTVMILRFQASLVSFAGWLTRLAYLWWWRCICDVGSTPSQRLPTLPTAAAQKEKHDSH